MATKFRHALLAPIPTIVAIPARDESGRIERCLSALAAQRAADGSPLPDGFLKVLVFINNTRDDTAARVRRWRETHRLPVLFRQVDLHDAHAGAARKGAMDWARDELAATPQGVICTTDADSEVDPSWLANTWEAFRVGADAVAGTVEFDPDKLTGLGLSALRGLEAQFAALQAQIIARLDPAPHDPWPNHIWAWGASLAVTSTAYSQIGGLPPAPLAEDRALVAALNLRDLKVRHALDVRVRTSTRVSGRAPGGLADLIRLYSEGDDASPCDAALRPVATIVEEAVTRRRLRRARKERRCDIAFQQALARRLRVGQGMIAEALAEPYFGTAWSRLSQVSPVLQPRRLFPCELPGQVVLAENVLRARRGSSAEHPGDRVRAASAGVWSTQTLSPP